MKKYNAGDYVLLSDEFANTVKNAGLAYLNPINKLLKIETVEEDSAVVTYMDYGIEMKTRCLFKDLKPMTKVFHVILGASSHFIFAESESALRASLPEVLDIYRIEEITDLEFIYNL